MTTLVAVKKNGKAYLAADKRVSCNGFIKPYGANKIHKFKNTNIGFTGSALVINELKFFINSSGQNGVELSMDNEYHIHAFFTSFKQYLSDNKVDDEDFGFLIVNKTGIYKASTWNGFEKIERDYHVLGSSEGIMCYLGDFIYKSNKSGKQIVKELMLEASKIDGNTSKEYTMVSVTLQKDAGKKPISKSK